MSTSCYINHKPADSITSGDRGLAYGDGLFETIMIRAGQLGHWRLHWQRLQSGCHRLSIPLPDEGKILNDIEALRSVESADCIVKLIVTRGVGQRGYRSDMAVPPTVIISRHATPEFPVHYTQQGVAARFCDYRLPRNPHLAGLKHLNRLDQVLARQEWADEFQEGIMLDAQGEVIEGVMSNIFCLQGSALLTPVLDQAGVAGVMRARVMQSALSLGLSVREARLKPDDLIAADAVFLTNSVIGLWPIRQLAGKVWMPHPTVAQLLQQLELDT